jgi:hypothetical protein
MERPALLLIGFGGILLGSVVVVGVLALVSPFFSWLAP